MKPKRKSPFRSLVSRKLGNSAAKICRFVNEEVKIYLPYHAVHNWLAGRSTYLSRPITMVKMIEALEPDDAKRRRILAGEYPHLAKYLVKQ